MGSTSRSTSAVPTISDRHPCQVLGAHTGYICPRYMSVHLTKTHTRVHSCCTNNDEKFKITQTPVFIETDKLRYNDAMKFYTAVK